jgi:phospholipid/cholesterol/gamma-HCH transport system substrate-binding protein
MDRSPVRDTAVGLFVLAGLLAMAYLSISIGGFALQEHGGLQLSAGFDEIAGLTVRAPVVIAGVRVGEVTAISLDPDFRAKIDMNLQSTLQLPSDTTASIVTSGVLGDRYIELQPGGDDKILKSGDRIAFTESAVILERLIGQFLYGSTKSAPKTQPGEIK